MPYIDMKTNVKLSDDQFESLKTSFGKDIESIPGKTESRLMVEILDGQKMWFKGSDEACAMIDVAAFGALSSAACNKMTACVTETVASKTGISPDRIYVKYSGFDNWGCNGSNF